MTSGVCITGIGLVSSLGVGVEPNWQGLCAGARAVRSRVYSRSLGLRGVCGCPFEVDVRPLVRRGYAKLMNEEGRMGLVACTEAVRSAGLADTEEVRDASLRVAAGMESALVTLQLDAVCEGSFHGAVKRVDELGVFGAAQKLNPLDAIRQNKNMLAAHLSINLGITSMPSIVAPGASFTAIPFIDAVRAIQDGSCSVAVVGSAELNCDSGTAQVVRKVGCNVARLRRHEARQGAIVLGNGAAFLVLESEGNARARGASPLARILGCGEAIGADQSERLDAALARALSEAEVGLDDVDFVHTESLAGGGLAPERDVVARRLDGHTKRMRATSSRAAVGNLFAAAPGFDLASVALSLDRGQLPPVPRTWRSGFGPLDPVVVGTGGASPQCGLVCSSQLDEVSTAVVMGRA